MFRLVNKCSSQIYVLFSLQQHTTLLIGLLPKWGSGNQIVTVFYFYFSGIVNVTTADADASPHFKTVVTYTRKKYRITRNYYWKNILILLATQTHNSSTAAATSGSIFSLKTVTSGFWNVGRKKKKRWFPPGFNKIHPPFTTQRKIVQKLGVNEMSETVKRIKQILLTLFSEDI